MQDTMATVPIGRYSIVEQGNFCFAGSDFPKNSTFWAVHHRVEQIQGIDRLFEGNLLLSFDLFQKYTDPSFYSNLLNFHADDDIAIDAIHDLQSCFKLFSDFIKANRLPPLSFADFMRDIAKIPATQEDIQRLTRMPRNLKLLSGVFMTLSESTETIAKEELKVLFDTGIFVVDSKLPEYIAANTVQKQTSFSQLEALRNKLVIGD